MCVRAGAVGGGRDDGKEQRRVHKKNCREIMNSGGEK